MAGQATDTDTVNQGLRVKATFKLGSELYAVDSCTGNTVSEQLVSMKEQSMSILKEFITKHNVPTDVPDELAESSSKSSRSLKLKRRNQNSLDISFVLCSKLKIYPGQNIPGIKRR